MWTIAAVLLILRIPGLVSSCTMGGLHILPVIAIVVVLISVIRGRKPQGIRREPVK